jgi:molecular chaperone GrpE
MKPEEQRGESADGQPEAGAEPAPAGPATATPEASDPAAVQPPPATDTEADLDQPDEGLEESSPSEPEPDPLEAAQAEVERWKDKCLRTAADFDNYRKRARREVDDAVRRAREDLLRDLLPVFDNLERAVSHGESATDVQALVEGLRMVMRVFGDTLSKLGVSRVQSVGEPFDPALHEAIQQLESNDYPPGSVAAEVLAGYRMGERLIRPASVVVAKPSGAPGADTEPSN